MPLHGDSSTMVDFHLADRRFFIRQLPKPSYPEISQIIHLSVSQIMLRSALECPSYEALICNCKFAG
ncbi:hypothetical protein MRB53_006791 [Persea americana]|uniref:Uncharacterized protein n=1 Tax=Persea americana TaxID=3435 RepID=A0ACC2MI37_PERAE|nr:hypothetical protein MRB53_006791 [Persea americana]